MHSIPIRFVSAQPDEPHFIWQCHVYLHNFLTLGIPPQQCVALFGLQGSIPSPQLRRLMHDFPEADIQIYPDTRDPIGRSYAPSIQPHVIVKAYHRHPHWQDEIIFFHDCDIVFRRLPDFDRMLHTHPGCCLLSNTIDYIGYGYLHKCCEKIREERPELPPDHLLHRMCEVVGMDVGQVKAHENSSGGAQYLLQGVDAQYWEHVYRDSLNLKKCFDDYAVTHQLKHQIKHYIQAWTAGMWAYLWNLWLREHKTVIHKEMGFVFSGAPSNVPEPIIHMAGLPDNLKHSHFDKQAWVHRNPIEVLRVQPFVFDHIPEATVSGEYVDTMYDIVGIHPWRERARPLKPARHWRVLAWQTASGFAWDVQQLTFEVEPPVQTTATPIESGNAGSSYRAMNAWDDNPNTYWGGRLDETTGRLPSYYLGVTFDAETQPKRVTLTQREGPHSAKIAILQYSHNGMDWMTAYASKLNPTGGAQLLFYHAEACHRARQWRIRSRQTASGWGWDVQRLAFLKGVEEQMGQPFSSGYVYPHDPPQYGHQHAFEDTDRYWGGRPDDNGHFHIGITHAQCLSVNRVILEQPSATLYTTGMDIQCSDDGITWRTVKTVTDLHVGINDIVLCESGPGVPEPPQVQPKDHAAQPTKDQLASEIAQLRERLEKLEARLRG